MLKKIENNPIVSIIIIVLVMLCVNISILDVTIMEARNFITAREMINDGNWLLTTMNGQPRYQKPPLPTWLTAISALAFGLKNILALRLPAILMVIITGIASFLLSKKLLNNKPHAFINALITITSFYVIGIIIEAPWDIFAHGFMLIAILHLFQLFEKEKNYWRHTLIAGVFLGFSILSKGPVSLYVLLLPFLFAYGVTYKFKGFRAKAFSVVSFIIIALLVGGGWYLYVRMEDPETFTAITSKETGNWGSYNVRPFYYYWSFFTQSGLWTIPAFIGLLYPYMKTRVSNIKAYRLSFYWTLFALILLSIIPEKKSRYLMPVLIPLAINTGFYIEYLIRKFKDIKDKKETFPVYFNFGIIALIGIAFPFIAFRFSELLSGNLLIMYVLTSISLIAISIGIIYYLKQKNIKNVFSLCILFLISIMVLALPLSTIQEQPNYNSISNLKAELESQNIILYSFGTVSPEMIWHYGREIPSLKIENNYQFPEEIKFGILTRDLSDSEFSALNKEYTLELIETFDINKKTPDTRGYKKRLTNNFYLVTKK